MVWLWIGVVRVEESLESDGAKNAVIHVLDVTAEFVVVPGVELGMTHGGEMDDLSDDASNTIVPSHDG